MPRGYLKRQAKTVGRKSARGGGNGRRGDITLRTCNIWGHGWGRKELRQTPREEREQDRIMEEINNGYEAYFCADYYFDSLSVQSITEEDQAGPDAAPMKAKEEREDSSIGEHSRHRAVKPDEGSFDPQSAGDDDATESFFVLEDDTEGLETNQSYSFCNTISEDSVVFSLVQGASENRNDESSVSTIWEFLSASFGNDEASF